VQTYEGIQIIEEQKEKRNKERMFLFPLVSPSGNAGLDSEPRNWLAITTVDYSSELTQLQYCLLMSVDGK
jgi:hypothetical protein